MKAVPGAKKIEDCWIYIDFNQNILIYVYQYK